VSLVKCVVWDLDETVWPGVAIESVDDELPRVRPEVLRAIGVLEERGIVSSVASRTDPGLLDTLRAHPDVGDRFVAPHLSWGHKSEAIAAIADELGIGTDAIAFVDDNAFERAEVANGLPEVRVLTLAELFDSLERPAFRPATVTQDARQRPRRYREEQERRAAARDFAGRTEEFLRASDIRLDLRPATEADLDRLAELVERTHRLNTTGEPWPADRLRQVAADPSWLVPVARLTDRFGDYGLIGAALIDRAEPEQWALRLFMVSCRAAGRDVAGAFLGRLVAAARRVGAERVLVDIRPSSSNLELRVLLRGAGFTTGEETAADGIITLARGTGEPLPDVPWLTVAEELPA